MELNVLCSTDKTFVPYCGIMLTSLLLNNQNININIYVIIGDNVTDEDTEILNKQVLKYNQKILFIKLDSEQYKFCPIRRGDKVSLAAYYRILAPEILPKEINKVLYLDCDIIINGDLKPFYNMDIENYSCAAVFDPIAYREDEYIRLGYPKSLSYFNSGVLLMNLEYWRDNNITKQCIDFIRKYPERVIWHDQDVLNYVLRESKYLVDITYNFQSQFMYKKKIWGRLDQSTEKRIQEVLEEGPVIIHYANTDKPWINRSLHPYVCFYKFYKNKSPWKNERNINNAQKRSLKSFLYQLLVRLKIKKRPTRYIIYPIKKT